MKSAFVVPILLLLLSIAAEGRGQVVPPKQPLRLGVDAARFRGADDTTGTVEIHYSVGQAGLSYMPDSAGYDCAADVTFLLRMRDSLVLADRWLVPHDVRDTSEIKSGMNLVGVYPVQLPRGDYVLKAVVRDRHAPQRMDSTTLRFPVRPVPTDKIMLSDIEFASAIRPSKQKTPFTKNTLDVIPNVGGLYGEHQQGFIYVEAYGLLLGDDRSNFKMRTSIFDAVGKPMLSKDRTRKRAGESAVLLDQFDTDSLKTGTYTLIVALLDTTSAVLTQSARRFFVYNPSLGIDSTLLASASSVPLAIYAGMPESELDREFRWSKYEMTKPEKSQYEQLSGADAKRKLLSDLWRKRPAGTRDTYMTRVTYANANFGVMGREGYRSDRGRVYITYGTPDDFERHPNESDSKAYEIWTYHSLQGGAIFVFVQKNQGGEYDLVHSTLRGELQDENWQRFIQTN